MPNSAMLRSIRSWRFASRRKLTTQSRKLLVIRFAGRSRWGHFAGANAAVSLCSLLSRRGRAACSRLSRGAFSAPLGLLATAAEVLVRCLRRQKRSQRIVEPDRQRVVVFEPAHDAQLRRRRACGVQALAVTKLHQTVLLGAGDEHRRLALADAL